MVTYLDALHQFYGPIMGVRIARKHIGWFLDNLNVSDVTHSEILAAASTHALEPVHLKSMKRDFNQLEDGHQQRHWLCQLADNLALRLKESAACPAKGPFKTSQQHTQAA